MAKRYFDSGTFKDPWFYELNHKAKLFWFYILLECDHAGIAVFGDKLASNLLGFAIDRDFVEKNFGDRIHFFGKDNLFIPNFLKYQYPNGIQPEASKKASNVFKSIHKQLKLHNLYPVVDKCLGNPWSRVREPLSNPSPRIIDIDIDIDIDNNKKGENFSFDEVTALWNNMMPKNGFSNADLQTLYGGKNRANFLETIKLFPEKKDWVDVFNRLCKSSFYKGDGKGSWKATLGWVVNFDNFTKIKNGEIHDGSFSIPKEMQEWVNEA